jgi:hypothetical protein
VASKVALAAKSMCLDQHGRGASRRNGCLKAALGCEAFRSNCGTPELLRWGAIGRAPGSPSLKRLSRPRHPWPGRFAGNHRGRCGKHCAGTQAPGLFVPGKREPLQQRPYRRHLRIEEPHITAIGLEAAAHIDLMRLFGKHLADRRKRLHRRAPRPSVHAASNTRCDRQAGDARPALPFRGRVGRIHLPRRRGRGRGLQPRSRKPSCLLLPSPR